MLENQLVEGQARGGQPLHREVHEALHAPRVVRVRHEVGGPSGGVRARLRASYRPVELRAPVSARDRQRAAPRLAQGVEEDVHQLDYVGLRELGDTVVYLEPGGRVRPLELLEREMFHFASCMFLSASSPHPGFIMSSSVTIASG